MTLRKIQALIVISAINFLFLSFHCPEQGFSELIIFDKTLLQTGNRCISTFLCVTASLSYVRLSFSVDRSCRQEMRLVAPTSGRGISPWVRRQPRNRARVWQPLIVLQSVFRQTSFAGRRRPCLRVNLLSKYVTQKMVLLFFRILILITPGLRKKFWQGIPAKTHFLSTGKNI